MEIENLQTQLYDLGRIDDGVLVQLIFYDFTRE